MKTSSMDAISVFYINEDKLVLNRENSVYDICRDGSGNIYIPDYRNNKIFIFDSQGNQKKVIEDIPFVHGLIVDRQNCLYAATYRNKRIFKFNSSYEPVPGWDNALWSKGILGKPIAFAVTQENNLIICDYERMSVSMVDSEGKWLFDFDDEPLRANDKYLPHAAIIDAKGIVYIADRANRDIHNFSLEGQYHGVWASFNAWDPQCIKYFNDDILMVADCVESKFYLFNCEGELQGCYGRKGHSQGEFQTCTNFVSDGQDYVYTVEEDSNRIQKLSHQTILSGLDK